MYLYTYIWCVSTHIHKHLHILSSSNIKSKWHRARVRQISIQTSARSIYTHIDSNKHFKCVYVCMYCTSLERWWWWCRWRWWRWYFCCDVVVYGDIQAFAQCYCVYIGNAYVRICSCVNSIRSVGPKSSILPPHNTK